MSDGVRFRGIAGSAAALIAALAFALFFSTAACMAEEKVETVGLQDGARPAATGAQRTLTDEDAALTAHASDTVGEHGLVQACGLGFVLPDETVTWEQGKDRAYWWVAYPDDGAMFVSVDRRTWSGDDKDLAAFALDSVKTLASTDDTAVVDEGGWRTYGDVKAYACGFAGSERVVLCAVTAVGDEDAARLLFSYSGPAASAGATDDIAAALASLRIVDDPYIGEAKRGRIMFYDVLDIVQLDGDQVLEVLEDDWQLTYVDSGSNHGWIGDYGEPLDASAGCEVVLVARDADLSGASAFASRDDLLAGIGLAGMSVQWTGVPPVEWDEPADIAKILQKECGLTDALDDGYIGGWGDDGSFAWTRLGRCQIDGEDAYWAIEVVVSHEGDCTVAVSADLLNNGYGEGFSSYDDVVSAVFGD